MSIEAPINVFYPIYILPSPPTHTSYQICSSSKRTDGDVINATLLTASPTSQTLFLVARQSNVEEELDEVGRFAAGAPSVVTLGHRYGNRQQMAAEDFR